ncbi:Pentatricopeptide repeat-containing protein [Vigna angularis]|uniref:Pentatricopeptide repeat-containing protein n=1 Tax=Phaseolus angularis TaxID=3914 RepID=A0A8T0JU35_PHAAN|nr:Pentatricopeptide repeat-containing protein [Vigna angularis]
MIRRPSIYLPTLFQSFSNSTFTDKTLLSAASSSSTTTLITIHDSHSNRTLSPFYNLLPPTQNPNNIVNLISSILKHESSHLSLLQNNDIKGILSHLGPHEISRVLLRCQSDHASAITFFNWVKKDLNITPTVQNYCVVLHILAWSGVFSQAMEFLSELIQMVEVEGVCVSSNGGIYENLVACTEDCNWNPVIFDMLVKAYVKVGMVEKGLETFRRNIEACFIPNVIACNCLLSGLSRFNYITQCWEVYEEMGKLGMVHRGIDPDIVSYNTLVCGYCKRGKMQMCRSVLYEMIGNRICPDSITCRLIVDGYVRDGKLVSALNTVEELKKYRIKIPEEVYDYLVVALCKEGKPFAARSFLQRVISQDGYIPKRNTYNKLVESLCGFNNVEEALVLKSEMEKKSMKVNIVAYRALISCLCRVKRSLEAESLLEEMISSGMLPDVEISRALIKGYCQENKIDKAVFLLKLFAKEFQVYDNESYNAVVKVFCDVGNVTELMEIQDKLLKVGYVPNKLTCRYVIHGLQKAMEVDDEILP